MLTRAIRSVRDVRMPKLLKDHPDICEEIEEKVREHYGLKRKTPADAAAKSEKAATGKVEKSGADAKEQSLTEKE